MPRKRHFTDAGMDCLRTLRLFCISTKPARPQSAGLLQYNRKRLSTSAGPDLSIVAPLSISQVDLHKKFTGGSVRWLRFGANPFRSLLPDNSASIILYI